MRHDEKKKFRVDHGGMQPLELCAEKVVAIVRFEFVYAVAIFDTSRSIILNDTW
jgi:hypothetical protein